MVLPALKKSAIWSTTEVAKSSKSFFSSWEFRSLKHQKPAICCYDLLCSLQVIYSPMDGVALDFHLPRCFQNSPSSRPLTGGVFCQRSTVVPLGFDEQSMTRIESLNKTSHTHGLWFWGRYWDIAFLSLRKKKHVPDFQMLRYHPGTLTWAV